MSDDASLENRTGMPPIPEDLSAYLTENQRLAVRSIEGFGWELKFVRRRDLARPVVVVSNPTGQMLGYPFATFVRFCRNHGLLQINRRPQWRTVLGGGREYVKKLLAGIGTASSSARPSLPATSATFSRSRTPQSGFLARRLASNASLLCDVCAPPRMYGP